MHVLACMQARLPTTHQCVRARPHTIIPVRVIVRHNASGSEHLRWSGSVENWPCMCACERMHAHMHVYNLLLARAQRERARAREREKRRAKRERDLPLPSALGGSGACEIGTRTRDFSGEVRRSWLFAFSRSRSCFSEFSRLVWVSKSASGRLCPASCRSSSCFSTACAPNFR